MRELIALSCSICKHKNYHTSKNKRKHPDKLETKKFCRSCRKYSPHKETKP